MGGIFISYRREDSGPYAGRLRDALSHHFGAEQVFRDIDSNQPGRAVPPRDRAGSGLVPSLAGPHWAHVAVDQRRRGPAPAGRPRRLCAPGDRDRPRPGGRRAGHPRPCRPDVDARRRRPAEALGIPRGVQRRASQRRELGRPGGTPDEGGREGSAAARGGIPTSPLRPPRASGVRRPVEPDRVGFCASYGRTSQARH